MEFEIVVLRQFSGSKATIYSVIMNGENETLFDKFLSNYKDIYPEEVKDIVLKLETIGKRQGARDVFFKLKEGVAGDGICALYDLPSKHLRLYCIKWGTSTLLVGGGGLKDGKTRKWQDSDELKNAVEMLMDVSARINHRMISEKDLKLSDQSNNLEGDLKFN